MANKKELDNKKGANEVLLIGIILITLLLVNIQGVVGESGNETLQQELDNLTQYLTSQGYDWLINYSINYPEVEVYRENSDELIAVIDNISGENWYKTYLELNLNNYDNLMLSIDNKILSLRSKAWKLN